MDRWIQKTLNLLEIEREADLDEAKVSIESGSKSENTLFSLKLANTSTTLFGKSQAKFEHQTKTMLPAHRITVGDIVQIRSLVNSKTNASKTNVQAIVARVTPTSLSLLFEEIEALESLQPPFRIDRLANDASYRKVKEALLELRKSSNSVENRVFNVAFYDQLPQQNPQFEYPVHSHEPVPFTLYNTNLNASQRDAIQFALRSKDVALIHGPPGTGKTTTLIELIQQAVRRFNLKVLVCAPSNIAVDNLVLKLAEVTKQPPKVKAKTTTLASEQERIKFVRLGHPARLLPQVLKHCLDAQVQAGEGTAIVNDISTEMNQIQQEILKTRDKTKRRKLRQEFKLLRKDRSQREDRVVKEILQQANVILATNVGAASRVLKDHPPFDLVIIDEAAQALEATCWIPLQKAKRGVLAGDHCQLPPTIKSKEAQRKGLDITLFDRLLSKFEKRNARDSIVRLLDTQYRMHHHISDWASKVMYENRLQSAPEVALRKIHDLSYVKGAEDLTDATLVLLDTAGCDMEEDEIEEDAAVVSKANTREAHVVKQHVAALVDVGLRPIDIAVITPYRAQVDVLRALFAEEDRISDVEVKTVDGFQGCEKEVIVLSFVRSNSSREVGFLADSRRINVAVTRAKRQCAIVCDTDTVGSDSFIQSLLTHFEEFGEHRSAEDYAQEDMIDGTHQLPQLLAATAVTPAPKNVPTQVKEKVVAPKQTSVDREAKVKNNAPKETRKKEEKGTKPPTSEVTPPAAPVEVEEKEEEQEEEFVSQKSKFAGFLEEDSDEEEKEESAADIKKRNEWLTNLHQEKVQRKPAPPISRKKKAAKKTKQKQPPQEEPDLDTLLDAAVASSKCCSFSGCKEKIELFGSICKHCKLKFCLKHSLPEIHGCGVDARVAAKTSFQNSTRTSKKSQQQRQVLQAALHTKVLEQTTSRQSKTTTKKKKKKK